jgi:signal transduction histidine kinase
MEETHVDFLRDIAGQIDIALQQAELFTDLKQKTAQLELQNEQLWKGKASEEEFLSFVGHEIRNPLSGVLSTIVLLKDTELSEEQTEYIKIIEEAGGVILSLVNNILDDKQLGADRLRLESIPVEIKNLVQSVVDQAKPLLQYKNVNINVDCPAFIPVVLCDPIRLKQILNNFLGNACKFTSEGTIYVRCSVITKSDACEFRFEVEDTGIGMSKEQKDTLFQPYQQVPSIVREYGGSGLGLSICKKLVELMGGEIGVVSIEGKGSMFWAQVTFSKVPQTPLDYTYF